MPSVRSALLSSLALAASACGTSAAWTEADRASVRAASVAWFDAAAKRDFARLASMYTEDAALLVPSSGTLRGRAAIEAFFNAFPPFKELARHEVEIEGRGDLAYQWGGFSMEVQIEGAWVPDRGKFLEIWQRQTDGSWKLARDIYNAEPTPGDTAAP